MTDLAKKTCIPCRGGVPPLKGTQLADLQEKLKNLMELNSHMDAIQHRKQRKARHLILGLDQKDPHCNTCVQTYRHL